METTEAVAASLITARTVADVESTADRALTTLCSADRSQFILATDGDVGVHLFAPVDEQAPRGQRAVVDGILKEVYSSGKGTIVDDLADTRSAATTDSDGPREFRSLLCEPAGDWGVLVALGTDQSYFDEETQEQIKQIASYVDTALERIQATDLQDNATSVENVSAIVAHDLRNPLQVAAARLEMIQQECDSEHIPVIARALDRMRNLIDNLLMSSSTDLMEPDTEDVDLASVVDESWQHIHTPEATLENRTTRTVRADQAQLKQLFENLLRNAIDHAGDAVTITVDDFDQGFFLEDDGPGIPVKKRTEVFDAGFSTDQGGSGLGLAITEHIVDVHGWDIAITDGSDGGARFVIRCVTDA